MQKIQNRSSVRRVRYTRALSQHDVTIVIPTLNEETGLDKVLEELLRFEFTNILVVDGYSTDRTTEIAKKRGVTVVTQHGRGKTGAIVTAIEHVTTPYILVMDGDFTYDGENIDRFLQHANSYDQIIGSRLKDGGNISGLHRFGNVLITKSFNLLMGTSLSDVCSGMYLLKTSTARELNFQTSGFDVEVEIAAQIATEGKITEVPIRYRPRVGKQKLSTWRHGFQILRSILTLARRYNPALLFSAVSALAGIPAGLILLLVLFEWIFRGVFHSGWALAGAMFLIVAAQGLVLGTISILLRRMESRLSKRITTEESRLAL